MTRDIVAVLSPRLNREMTIRHANLRLIAGVILALLASAPAAVAQQDLHTLVSGMVQNELKVQKQQYYWMYVDSNTTPKKSEVKRVVQTPECWLSWPITIDGKAPTAAQMDEQRDKLNKLVNDRGARDDQRKQVDADGKKAENLLKILPDAFLYSPDGEENGLLRLKFRPNPNFNPPTRAAKVFHNMEGTLLIDKKEQRFAGMSGVLSQDVTFGWGILGRLYKGGTFEVRQTEEAPGDWEVTLLNVHMKGRALFFATISEQQSEKKTDFQPSPKGVSLAQLASQLEHGENLNASAK